VAVGNILTGVGSSTSSFGVACTSLATSATVESDPYEPGTAQLNVTDATFAGCTGPDNSPLTITEETYPITESISDAAGDPVTTGAQTVDVDSLAFGFDCQYSASGGSGSWSNSTNSATITGETYSLTGGTGNTNLCPPSTVSSLSLPATVDSSVTGHPAVVVASAPSTPIISNLPSSAASGGSFTPVVTTDGDGATSVTSSTPLTCTVDPDTASVSFLIAGSCTLTAQVAAGADYSGAVGDPQTFTISPATPTTPTITNLPSSGAADTHFTAVVATTGDGATSVISSTPAVCTASGLVVAFVEPGICTLEAQVAAGAAYGAAEGSPQNVSVTVTISSVVFSGTEANPTVTAYGSGFGAESGLGTPVSSGGTGYYYGSNLTFADSTDEPWTTSAGSGPGFLISSYSNTQITFTFDSLYSSVEGARNGDTFTLTAFGVTSEGKVSYPPAGQNGPGPFAFVAGSGSPTRTSLTPVDTSSNTAEPSFSGGTDPVAVAISPNGSVAYVVNQSGSDSVSEISTATDSTIGSPIPVGSTPDNIALSPDGATAYVTDYGSDSVTAFSTTDPTAAATVIPVGHQPDDVAITPNGATGYVTSIGSDTVTAFSTADPTASISSIDVGTPTAAVAISPDGSTAYVTTSADTVIPIPTSTNIPGPSIPVGQSPVGIAITPDGSTAFVANTGDGTVTPITLSPGGGTAATAIAVGGTPFAVAIVPNGSEAYVTNVTGDTVVPIDAATETVGTPIPVGQTPYSLAIAPDQGPTASLQATTSDGVTNFDASGSGTGTSSIASYAWNFGDGTPTQVSSSATTSHTYATSGSYVASVTETDTAGTSTTEVYTGHTASLNGGSGATASATVQIQVTDCSVTTNCTSGPVGVAATATTPAQTVTVTAPSSSLPGETLTVGNSPGLLECGGKGFQEVGNITSFNANFQPTGNVTLTDAIPSASAPAKVKVCFQGATGKPTDLKRCNPELTALPCANVGAGRGGGVLVTLVDSAGDPRFHVINVGVLEENPTAFATKGTVGKVFKIKGTSLLGAGQNYPTVDFTSCDGTIDAKGVLSVTASNTTSLSVVVPNSATTGAMQLVWSNPQTSTDPPSTETALSQGSVTVTGSRCTS
jgi:YVTN family beta-propeller protein